jgi:hypothetical protein
MSKRDERRLAKIEGSLTPKQLFLLWLEEARQHGSLADYVLSVRGQPIEQHPYQRLPRQVERAVRERYKAEKSTDPYERRSDRRALRERQIEGEVIRAVREVAFYLELHSTLTGRVSAEWKAMALQTLLALNLNRDLMRDDTPTQKDIDQARHFLVQSAGDLLTAQAMARQLAENYTDGRSLRFPEQERQLTECVGTAMLLVEYFNDHMHWLDYLRRNAKGKRTGEPKAIAVGASLDLTPFDVDELNAAVERKAATAATQLVYMAKGEAAQFVGQRDLAVEMLDRVWVGVE